MIKKEVLAHPSELPDSALGTFEGSNPKLYSLGCELSLLPYILRLLRVATAHHMYTLQDKVHHGLRYTDFLVYGMYFIPW